MKQPPTMLTATERRDFAPWLASIIEGSGFSKAEFATEMGDESTERLNRCLSKGRIPTKSLLAKIARVAKMPYARACLHAGYFDEIICAIAEYAKVAECAKVRAALPNAPHLRTIAIQVALVCFPRRNDIPSKYRNQAIRLAEYALDHLDSVSLGEGGPRPRERRKLPDDFAVVVTILREHRLSPSMRREIAAIVLADWARRFDAEAELKVRRELSGPRPRTALDLLRQPGEEQATERRSLKCQSTKGAAGGRSLSNYRRASTPSGGDGMSGRSPQKLKRNVPNAKRK
ncbi:MAG: hypothetical protein WB615_09690 [Candidatus Tumulicola sp.]